MKYSHITASKEVAIWVWEIVWLNQSDAVEEDTPVSV